MNLKHQRKLWHIRFLKILQLEQESFDFYKKLLEEKRDLLKEAGIQPILKQILREEGRHIRIAKELLSLVGEESPRSKPHLDFASTD